MRAASTPAPPRPRFPARRRTPPAPSHATLRPRPPRACAQDHEDTAEVNDKLESMGYGIGQRLIDELLAKSNVGQVRRPCTARASACAGARTLCTGATASGTGAPAAMRARVCAFRLRACDSSDASCSSSLLPALPARWGSARTFGRRQR